MKTIKRILYVSIPLAVLVIMVLQLVNNHEKAQNKVYRYNKHKPINVQADTLKLQKPKTDQSFPGIFEPDKETKISAEVQGRINNVFVEEGSLVKKGQSLIQLDNALLKLQLESVDVKIDGLEADVKRYSILTEADAVQGVKLEKAELGLKAALVQRNTILEQIRKTTILAPFNGIVTSKLVEEGAFAAPGLPLLQLTDISSLKFTIQVSENDIKLFGVNQSCKILADAYPGAIFQGEISLIGIKAGIGNSFPIQATMENTPGLKIKSGMFGELHLSGDNNEEQIIVPSSAIVGSTIQPKVYLIQNGKAILRSILVSERIENQAVVQGGLKEGDVIVTSGFINLFDGANVSIY